MKVKELIEQLEKYDGNIEVRTKERYTDGSKPVTEVKKQYERLDKTYIYIS